VADLTHCFPPIVETLARVRARAPASSTARLLPAMTRRCLVQSHSLPRHDDSTFLYAFDLIELNGDDLRRDPLEVRKATLASIVAKAQPGIRFNEHMEGDGPTVFGTSTGYCM
jgi:hypothetical protein